MPSSSQSGWISASTSRDHREYSTCTALSGCAAWACHRRRTDLAYTEIVHLALAHEITHCPDRVLDRHGRIDTMDVIKVDDTHALKVSAFRQGSRISLIGPRKIMPSARFSTSSEQCRIRDTGPWPR